MVTESDEKRARVMASVRQVIALIKDLPGRTKLLLVSRADAVGTEINYDGCEVDGYRIESSYLVPPGSVFVEAMRVDRSERKIRGPAKARRR
jgi:hypothetical protein